MPQGSRRSIGYRPFITCDDPRGVVECGTIRKPKSTSTQKGKHEKKNESQRRKQRNLNNVRGEDVYSKEMAIGGGCVVRVGGEQAQSPTSLHLLEVSKGAQKLNHVVSSWSDGHSKSNNGDIAKDLLKGALDLGESLAMLSRWRHSSSYMSGSTKKQQKQKTERDGFAVDLKKEGKDSVGLRDEMQDMGSHGHRLSGSSRDQFEEIKRVIQDGFDRKDVFSDPSSEEACDDRRLDSSDLPSTSSSQSSIVHSSNFVSPESFLSSAASKKKNKKLKGSNLIARLMGLEDASLRSLPNNQKKPAFDLDSPRARKHEHDDHQKSGWKRRTLDQMIEAMKFKGLPKSSLLNGVRSFSNSHHSEFSYSKQRWEGVDSDNRPPIVIMRPIRFSCLNLEDPIIPKTRAEVDEEMLLKMRIRTNPLAQTDQCETLNFNENVRKAGVDGAPAENSNQGEVYFDGTIMKEKTEVEESKTKGKASSPGKSRTHKKHGEEAQKMTGSRRKGEMKRRTKSESDMQFQDGDKLTILKLKSSREANSTTIDMRKSAPSKYGKQVTKCSSNSKGNWPENVKKVIKGAVRINGDRRYGDENGEVDSICGITTLAEDASQIEITDYVGDDHSSPRETPLLSSKRRDTQTANGCGTTDRYRESQCCANDNRPVEEGQIVCSADEKHLYPVCDTNLHNAYEVESVDLDHHANDIQSTSSSDIASQDINQSGATIHIEEKENPVCLISTPSIDHSGSRKGTTGENRLKALLLSSPQFINRAEELFYLKVNPDKDFLEQIDSEIDHNDLNARMLLDCANELMELHSSKRSTACLPFPRSSKMSSISYYYTSFDRLLDEICDGIEALSCYREADGDDDSTDSLLFLVKGDLRSRGMVSGVWDVAWMHAASADEFEEITRGVDNLVLDGLIEEILVDLSL